MKKYSIIYADPPWAYRTETPYSTRYFVLRYDGDGDLEQADLTHIAAVSEDDTAQYLTAALRHGAGFGYTAGYKYYVVHTDTDRWMAWQSSSTAIRSCTRS